MVDGKAAHNQAAGISARSRAISDENFAAAKIFQNFRSEIHRKSHEISRATACRRSGRCLGTPADLGKAVNDQSAGISARFRAISDENFGGREKFQKFSVEIALGKVRWQATC